MEFSVWGYSPVLELLVSHLSSPVSELGEQWWAYKLDVLCAAS